MQQPTSWSGKDHYKMRVDTPWSTCGAEWEQKQEGKNAAQIRPACKRLIELCFQPSVSRHNHGNTSSPITTTIDKQVVNYNGSVIFDTYEGQIYKSNS